MSNGHYNVLFLSNRNTVRSIFAEAVMNRIGRENFTGFSAGMRPAEQLDLLVHDILRVAQYPTDALHPKHWKEFARPDSPPLDFVFTLCDPTVGAAAALAGPSGHRGLALCRPTNYVEKHGSDARN